MYSGEVGSITVQNEQIRIPNLGLLKMEMFMTEIKRFARKHEERLHRHDNVEAIQLLDNSGLLRRLKRIKPFELAN